jgi:Phage integrase family/Phage integrase, N-terminal SAM-like domain/Arm DNA-binding domain
VRGSIRSRGADNWQVRVSLGRDPETGRYRYVSRYVHGTKRDAQRAAAELITEVDRGGHREEGRHTVKELLDRWMAHIEAQGRAESTLARYRSCINANIKPRLGSKATNKLGPADLDRYYAQLARAGLSPLTIARSISDANQLVAVKDTKTHQARRIALDPSTVGVLRAHRDRVNERAAMAGVSLSPDAYVWSQDLDAATPYRPDRVTGAFRTLRDRLELPHVTFHSLRHFTATTLAAEGVGIRTIAGRLGHANPGITLRTYAHFLDAADREAATAIGEALAGIQPASANRSKASTKARRGTTSRRPKRTEGSSRLATRS